MSRPMADESVFRAAAHPIRRRMLDMLRVRERTVAELYGSFKLSRQAFSQHLRILRTTGLVKQRRNGRSRVYWLERSKLRPLLQWAGAFDKGTR